MLRILLVAHGGLSHGFLSAASLLYGDCSERVVAISFFPGQSPEELESEIEEQVLAADGTEGCLVLCDILGGSPFLASASVYNRYRGEKPLEVVTGLNLAMLVEVLAMGGEIPAKQAAEAAVAAAGASIKSLSDSLR
jgi:mannose/fructose/sorbose-specific phosphotransferase system IIA component